MEAHTCYGNVFLISIRQMNGTEPYVNHLIDNEVGFALVSVVSGSFNPKPWKEVAHENLTKKYFLSSDGLYWFIV